MKRALSPIPVTLAEANAFCLQFHRHHFEVVGHRFSVGVAMGDELVGVAICGRPTARLLPARRILYVSRLATTGAKNACSFLYARAARIGQEMGFLDIETAILDTEPGVSLRAAGWEFRRMSRGGDWNRPSRGGRRVDQPMGPKQIWGKALNSGGVA